MVNQSKNTNVKIQLGNTKNKSKSTIKTNKDNQMKKISYILTTLAILYGAFVLHSLWNSFTTVEEIEETFIEVENEIDINNTVN